MQPILKCLGGLYLTYIIPRMLDDRQLVLEEILPLDTVLRLQNTKPGWTRKWKHSIQDGLVLAIAVCERLRQGDCYECEASLGYTANSRPT